MRISEEEAIAVIALIEKSVTTALKKSHPNDVVMWRTIGYDQIDGVMMLVSHTTPDIHGEILRATAAGMEAQARIMRTGDPAVVRAVRSSSDRGAGVLR